MSGRLDWLEINTQGLNVAQSFYEKAFLWKIRALHTPGLGLMPIFSSGDREFANGFMAMGTFSPPYWFSSFSGNISEGLSRAEKLGGKILGGPNEYKGWSRNLSIADPEGGKFLIIEMENPPEGKDVLAGQPLCAELWAKDAAKMANFYSELFGLKSTRTKRGWKVGESMFIRDNPFHRPYMPWIPYFKSNGLGADQRRVELFGAIPQGPRSSADGIGELAIYADPSGAFFGLVEQ